MVSERMLTVREVAAMLRVSTATIYALCRRGELEHVRVGNAIRFPPSVTPAGPVPRPEPEH